MGFRAQSEIGVYVAGRGKLVGSTRERGTNVDTAVYRPPGPQVIDSG